MGWGLWIGELSNKAGTDQPRPSPLSLSPVARAADCLVSVGTITDGISGADGLLEQFGPLHGLRGKSCFLLSSGEVGVCVAGFGTAVG